MLGNGCNIDYEEGYSSDLVRCGSAWRASATPINAPTENINKLEILKTEFDLKYEYIAQGAIVRSRARWYELGEKSNKYFLNLESSRGKKSVIRKIGKIMKTGQTRLLLVEIGRI